jgi:hypothetical protein
MRRSWGVVWMFLVLLISSLPAPSSHAESPSPGFRPDSSKPAAAPLLFVQNAGQFAPEVDFQIWGAGRGVWWLAGDSIWVTLPARPAGAGAGQHASALTGGVNVRMRFAGANPASRPEPFDRQQIVISYFIGANPERWQPAVPVWGGVRYSDLYPGVDLELRGEAGRLVPRLVAHSGADLAAVQVSIEGIGPASAVAEIVRPDANGQLHLPLLSSVPEPNSSARIAGAINMIYSTYIGGSLEDWGYDIAVDSAGCAYITGETESSNFPKTAGAFDESFNQGASDAFVVKLNAAGTGLVYATFLGGDGIDRGFGIAVDMYGRAYITGRTESSNFPTPVGSWDRTRDGFSDAFVARLNATGTNLEYATYLGGTDEDQAFDIAVSATHTACVVGETNSANFPTTAGAYIAPAHGGQDAFVTCLRGDGSGPLYSALLGGSDIDSGRGIALDSVGAAYVTGGTSSSNFPTSATAWDRTYNGSGDAFAAKLDRLGSELVYSTFIGGSALDQGKGIAVDYAGQAYVRGQTSSRDFPTTPGAFDRSHNGGAAGDTDSFVIKLNSAGSAPVYSTYLGGIEFDWGDGIVVDRLGRAYVVTQTESPDFPTTAGAYDTSHNGYWDAALTVFSADGSALVYSTFLGGWYIDTGEGIALGHDGSIYLVGATESDNFPTTSGAYDRSCGTDGKCNFDDLWWYRDAFVTRFSDLGQRMVYLPLVMRRK